MTRFWAYFAIFWHLTDIFDRRSDGKRRGSGERCEEPNHIHSTQLRKTWPCGGIFLAFSAGESSDEKKERFTTRLKQNMGAPLGPGNLAPFVFLTGEIVGIWGSCGFGPAVHFKKMDIYLKTNIHGCVGAGLHLGAGDGPALAADYW